MGDYPKTNDKRISYKDFIIDTGIYINGNLYRKCACKYLFIKPLN